MKKQTTLFLLFVLVSTFSARGVKPAQASGLQAYAEVYVQAYNGPAEYRVDGPNLNFADTGSATSAGPPPLFGIASGRSGAVVGVDLQGNIRGRPWWSHRIERGGEASTLSWFDPNGEFLLDCGDIWIEMIFDGLKNIQGQLRILVEDQTGILFDVAVVYGIQVSPYPTGVYFVEDEDVGEWPYTWEEMAGVGTRWWHHPAFLKNFTPTGNARATVSGNGKIGSSEGSEGNSLSVKLTQRSVGGVGVSVDKFGLLAPYIGLASTLIGATVATAIYAKHLKRREEKR